MPPNNATLPRWIAITRGLVIWLIVIPLVHGVVPWSISTLMPRHGWSEGSPGPWNWIGLIPVTVATALLLWTRDWTWRLATPSFLMVGGPYRVTRNPIYVAYLGLWLGWALFFGSGGVLIGWLILCLVASLIIVPREERDLEAAFGEAYLQYKETAPRWFGKAKG